jgi:hypothetical protein
MKNFFSKQGLINSLAVFVGVGFIVTSLYSEMQNRAVAQTGGGLIDFSGTISIPILFCCNGIFFKLIPFPTSESKLPNYVHYWTNMPPQPFIGLGLYQWWNYFPKNRVLGSAIPGGVCLNPAADCSPMEITPPPLNVFRMGVTLQ